MSEKKRILAIDYGQKRIGIAYSDERHVIAMTYPTMLTEKKIEKTVKKLTNLIHQLEQDLKFTLECIVVGKPLLMSGKNSLMTDEVLYFIDLLLKEFSCPILAWDERLSSVQAERTLMEAEMTRKKRSKHVDQVAAVIILQSYLDHLHLKEKGRS